MFKRIIIKDKIWAVRWETNDEGIVERIFGKNFYQVPDSMTGNIVFDIGAHIGSFSILAKMRGADVYSFEPVSDSFSILMENLQQNNINVNAFMFGIGDSGFKEIYVDRDNFGASSLYKELSNYSHQQLIKLIPLSEVFNQLKLPRIDFLKIDCEGSESMIFKDIFTNHIDEKINTIAVEFHFPDDEEGIINKLKKDFDVTRLAPLEYLCKRK